MIKQPFNVMTRKTKRLFPAGLCTKVFFLIMLGFNGTISSAQQVSAAFAEFIPESFSGYPASGIFMATFGKTSGRIPAGTAQILFSMVPEVRWNGNTITAPTGWTISPESTPTNLRFVLSQDWSNESAQDIKWIIPVTASATRLDATVAVTSQIQQKDGNWSILGPLTNTSVTVAAVPLPVSLYSFDVKAEGQTARLNWATTAETNAALFGVERSDNGKKWSNIGHVEATGESSVIRDYFFTDINPGAGENLYRLKMLDLDGSFAYSRIRSIVFTSDLKPLFVYPNPASDQIKIDLETLKNLKSVGIFEASGRLVYSVQSPDLSEMIDLRSLRPGSYAIRVRDSNGLVRTSKFVIFR